MEMQGTVCLLSGSFVRRNLALCDAEQQKATLHTSDLEYQCRSFDTFSVIACKKLVSDPLQSFVRDAIKTLGTWVAAD